MKSRCLVLAGLLALSGCVTEGESQPDARAVVSPAGPVDAPPPAPPPPKPWTDAFMNRAALLADEVSIEGPDGLIDHVVRSADRLNHPTVMETTPDGLLSVTRVRDATSPEIRAQLDQLQIMALRKLTILERVGDVDVVVEARGAAYWHDPATGEQQRADSLRFTGRVER